MSALQKRLQSKGLPPMPAVTSQSNRRNFAKHDYSVLPWTDYYEERKKIVIGKNTFQFYQSGSQRTSLLLLFLHGGGFSGLSWALLTKDLVGLIDCRCVALDLRGHGGTSTENDSDMSAAVLVSDVCSFIEELNVDCPVVLIGHSMGGAIAVHAAVTNQIARLAGLVVVDVVEGTALEALKSMHHVLHNRPSHFDSVEKANEWCLRTGYIRNRESARVSMIGQLIEKEQLPTDPPQPSGTFTIPEEEDSAENVRGANKPSASKFVWRIDLMDTEPYWEGWFKGMSQLFLSVPVPKILMLAGVDRLDKDLSIGQMQGKFQLQVMAKSGHAVHEDKPDKVAEVVANFLVRHRLAEKR